MVKSSGVVLLLFATSVNVTSGQSHLTKGRIAAEHERFNNTRQVPTMFTSIKYTLPSANPSPHPEWHRVPFRDFLHISRQRAQPSLQGS